MVKTIQVTLHIGRHKTGTTSLQKFLALNEELLLNYSGILYPKLGRDPKKFYHHSVFKGVICQNQPMDKDLVQAIFNEAKAKGAKHILLSSEMMGRPTITKEQLKEILQSFGDHKVSLIIYLRQQDSFLQSRYAEKVKRGLLIAPDTIHDINDADLDYYKYIQKYVSVFGKENIKIRVFEHAIKTGIYEDFLTALDIQYNLDFVLPKKNANERWSWLYLELVRHANRVRIARKIMTHHRASNVAAWINRIFPHLMNRPRPLSFEERQILIEKYEQSNTRLAQKFLDRNELF